MFFFPNNFSITALTRVADGEREGRVAGAQPVRAGTKVVIGRRVVPASYTTLLTSSTVLTLTRNVKKCWIFSVRKWSNSGFVSYHMRNFKVNLLFGFLQARVTHWWCLACNFWTTVRSFNPGLKKYRPNGDNQVLMVRFFTLFLLF